MLVFSTKYLGFDPLVFVCLSMPNTSEVTSLLAADFCLEALLKCYTTLNTPTIQFFSGMCNNIQ